MPRDAQRGRLYRWEDAVIAPSAAGGAVRFADAQQIVDGIWADQGLAFPPKVEPLPRQARRLQADASRLVIRLGPTSPCWQVLHEIAHAMTSTVDGDSVGHGPAFVGIYVRLLARYLRMPAQDLLVSLRSAGIAVDTQAVPTFLDPVGPPRSV